jgi:hypothetical protein
VFGAIGVLSALQLSCFALFLVLIPSRFRSTFLSLKSGSQFCIHNFQNTTEDSQKFEAITNVSSMWSPIEVSIRLWLNERLPVWIDEDPDWWDDSKLAAIPINLLDDPALLNKLLIQKNKK